MANLSPSDVALASQPVGVASAPQAVTLSNSGDAALSISSIALAGSNPSDFTQTNNCGQSLASGANCTISVTFQPTAMGSRTSDLILNSNSGKRTRITGTGLASAVTLAPTDLAFSSPAVGSATAAQTITLANSGNSDLSLNNVSVTGANAGDFTQTNTCGTTVAAGANCTISVTFKPKATGTRTATIALTDNAPDTPQSVALSGTIATTTATASPTSVAFGNIAVGTASAAKSFSLSNTGTADLNVSAIAVSGTNPGDFSQTNDCGASVAAGASCTVNITFLPTTAGSRTASITVADNAAGSPQTVSLSGTGASAAVKLSSTSVAFGNEAVGIASAAKVVTLTNSGTAALAMSGIGVTGANANDFAATDNCGVSLAAGSSCTIGVTFTPSTTGARAASLSLADSAAGSPQTVALSGTGTSTLASASPSSVAFGNQPVSTASTVKTFTLTNSGTTVVNISGIAFSGTNASDFSQTNNCGSRVSAGANCTISVTFKPAAAGARAAVASITDDASSSPQTVSLSGTGTASAVGVSPSSIAFGNQPVGSSSTTRTITLTDSGTADLNISSVAVSGTNASNFSQTNNCGSGVTAGSSCAINVTFTPSASGDRSASITITDSATGSPQSVSLSGTGTSSAVGLSPTTIAFGNQPVGSSSTTHSITLTDSGTADLNISGVGVSGTNASNFSQTNNCGSSVAAGSSCTINVTFTPSASGNRSASVTITDSATGSPQSVSLSGTGTTSIVGLSSTTVAFGNQPVGSSSSAQAVTLSNSGAADLNVTSIAVSGVNASNFAQTNNCGLSVTAGASCTINVIFTPSASGSRSASITITDSATGSPQSITLSGTGATSVAGVSPSSIPFGNQPVGTTSAAQTVTLANSGNAVLNISSIAISGANSSDYSQINTCGSSVAASTSCTISVTFKPTANGSRSAAITVVDDATSSPQTVALSGTGTTALASASPSSIPFGSQPVGTGSAAQVVTLSNSGTAPLSVTGIAVSGSNAGDFTQSNNCGTTVAAGSSCSISVSFAPSATGSRSAALNIIDSTATSPETVSLSGTGTTAIANVSTASLAFGSQPVSTSSAAQAFTLSNSGNAALSLSGITVSGVNASDFTQTNNCGSSVAAGSSCTVNVTFKPAATGTRSAIITLTDSDASSPQTVSLAGTGTASAVSISPSSVSFGNESVGTTSTAQTVSLSNTGGADLSISGIAVSGTNASNFAQTNNCGSTVTAGASCTISVTFTPSVSGNRSASLTITDGAAGSPHTVALSGIGTSTVASLSPTGISFGNFSVGSSSTARAVTLSNAGNAIMNLSGISVTGTNPSDFSQTNNCGATVAAGGSCTINVVFSPTTTGIRNAAISIADDATGSPQSVALSGRGLAPAVNLSSVSLAFGNQPVGTATAAQAVTLTNSGNTSLGITSIALSGVNTNDFTESNNCGSTVAAGASCTISVTFRPVAGGDRAAIVSVADTATGSPQSIDLAGTGTTPAASLAPSTLSFGSLSVGTASAAQPITLSNTGNAALTITSVSVSGAAAVDYTETNNCGSSVAAGASCSISVTFKPTAAGTRSASISVADTATGSPQTVGVSGTGTAPSASVSSASLAFGSLAVGSTSTVQFVTLSNNGNGPLNITGISVSGSSAGDFTQTSNCGSSVAVSSSCLISVTFTPSVSGSRTASLAIADDSAGSPQSVSLSGTGTAPGANVSPASLVFGNQPLNTASASQPVTLTNTGNAALTVNGISVSGTNAGDFTQTNNCGSSVAAGSSCTISVAFNPTASGTRGASLDIADGAAGSPQVVTLSGTGTSAVATVSPLSVTFGNQSLNTSSTSQPVTLTNTGNGTLSVSSITVSGTNASEFTQANTCGSSVAAGASCTINVTFKPTAAGSRSASLSVADGATGSPQTVALSGTGAAPSVNISPSSLTFGNQSLNTSSTSLPITLTNTGNADLTLTSVTLTGSNATDFSQTNTCGASVAAGASCTINVTFKPTAAGSRTASLSVADSATGSPHTVGLSGTGAAPAANVSPSSLAFGSLSVGTASSAQPLTLTNTGNAALTITSITFSGTNSADFAQTNTCGSSVASGSSCTINVTFTPSATGSRTASLSIADNAAGSPQSATLSGTGTASSASVSPSSLTFTSSAVGTASAAKSITLSNTGNAALTVTSISVSGTNSSDFSQTNTCGSSVAAGGNCTISVIFTPSATGTRTASVAIVDNATGSPQSVSLSGSTTQGSASLSPGSLSFSTQPVATTSTGQTLTLTNTGASTLAITGVTVTGTNSGDFTANSTCGSALAVGAQCTIVVIFNPSVVGARTAGISIADNASGSPQTATLSGTGSHDVILGWSPSTTPSVIGYNIYRGTAAGAESSTPLNSTPLNATTFADDKVTAGLQYFYLITAVSSDGVTESAATPETSATIPTP